MGSPGSGKTTLARIVGTKLGMSSFDIDDDYLEKRWHLSVAEKVIKSLVLSLWIVLSTRKFAFNQR